MHRHYSPPRGTMAGALVTIAAGFLGVMAARHFLQRSDPLYPEDAPQGTLRRSRRPDTSGELVGRTVTIARPRQVLYDAWRDFGRFPEFMENVERVVTLPDGTSRWTIAAPAGSEVELVTRITDERPGELIAWESTEASDVRHRGRVDFSDAPGGRGTQVSLSIEYDPPGGRAGQLLAKLFQREPHIQARRDLKRFKQLMEAGEIATSARRPDAPAT